jgi:hypothetical protein
MKDDEANARIEAMVKAEPTYLADWHAELYCNNKPSCDLREIRIRVKEFIEDSPPRARATFVCPACGGSAKVHWIRSGDEYRDHKDREARWSVNLQRTRREDESRAETLSWERRSLWWDEDYLRDGNADD